MRIEYDILSKKRNNTNHSVDIELSDEEIVCLFEGVRDGIGYDEIAVSEKIKEKVAVQYNSNSRRKISSEDISYRLYDLQERAVRGAKDIETLVSHHDSMTILRKDGSFVTVTEEYGLIVLKDSKKPGEKQMLTADAFLSYILH